MGLRSNAEVYGLFAPLLPQVARDHYDRLPYRKRQGLVPDMLVACRWAPTEPLRDVLAELKTLHCSVHTYPASEERCHAVNRRAELIASEYRRKARALDRQWLGTPPNQPGPVELKLRGYGDIRGLVFGSWGEASTAVSGLLSAAVDSGAARRRCCNPSSDDGSDRVRAILAATLRRRWGMTALRANARLLLDRLAYVGRGATAAAHRRASSRLLHAARAVARSGGGPRLWQLAL